MEKGVINCIGRVDHEVEEGGNVVKKSQLPRRMDRGRRRTEEVAGCTISSNRALLAQNTQVEVNNQIGIKIDGRADVLDSVVWGHTERRMDPLQCIFMLEITSDDTCSWPLVARLVYH